MVLVKLVANGHKSFALGNYKEPIKEIFVYKSTPLLGVIEQISSWCIRAGQIAALGLNYHVMVSA